MKKMERALISVSNKLGIVEFSKGLQRHGLEILSTGGTARILTENGIKVQEVSDFTGHPEMLEGRVKKSSLSSLVLWTLVNYSGMLMGSHIGMGTLLCLPLIGLY